MNYYFDIVAILALQIYGMKAQDMSPSENLT